MIRIIRGNALNLPVDDNTVDIVVTSPPYFGLRSYQDSGTCGLCEKLRERGIDPQTHLENYAAHASQDHHYEGQIGSEATPAEFVDALIAATREMVRVLKPSGSIWVNLGDKYVADNRGSGSDFKRGAAKWAPAGPAGYPGEGTMPRKSLMGIPWRYALRCIDELGLILRAEVIWSKPNGLPESVTDRVRRSHEQWFHFTVSPRYYSAVDEIREPHTDTSEHAATRRARTDARLASADAGMTSTGNPLGKLPGSVWTIPTQPLRVPDHLGIDHFAAFPMEWPRRIITGWSPREVCSACGEGRRPVAVRNSRDYWPNEPTRHGTSGPAAVGALRMGDALTTITGYACACPDTTAPTTPGLVLDPFGGTGTTALVADVLGRDAIHVDLSRDYCRLAEWRTTDPGERARAMHVEKPEPAIPGQLVLEGLGA